MLNYVTGNTIKVLREKKNYTQKQLADILNISDKTISKWETGKGLPDVSLLEPLAKSLNVSVAELLSGEYITNINRSGNMLKSKFYVCPICGNVIQAIGEGSFSCCGINLPVQEAEEFDEEHKIILSKIENEWYLSVNHPMIKDHYISFIAYVTSNKVQLVKLYPEQNPEVRFAMSGHGFIYVFCNKHGLFSKKI